MLIGRCVFRAFRPRTTSQTEKVTSSERSREPALSEVERGSAVIPHQRQHPWKPSTLPFVIPSGRGPRQLRCWGGEARDLQLFLTSDNIQGNPQPPQLVTRIVEILNHGNPESQAVVLPMLAALPSDSPWATNPEVLSALRTLLIQQPRPQNYAAVLNAASSFKTLMRETDLQQQVLSGLNDPNPEVQRAAVRVSLENFL